VERGKLDAIGKGVRRPKSSVGGRLEFLTEATLLLHRGRNLDVISSVQTVRTHWTDLVEPERFAAASLVAEIVDAFCELDLPMPEVYALLTGVVAAIASATEPAALVPRFELRLLDALGLAPPSDVCARCFAPFGPHGAWIDAEAGGLGCERCCGGGGESDHLDTADVENFRAVGAPRGGAVRPATIATPRTARAIDALVIHHLGKRPKARALVLGGFAVFPTTTL
jgi:DNA repair protein RecO (recombination protein O)